MVGELHILHEGRVLGSTISSGHWERDTLRVLMSHMLWLMRKLGRDTGVHTAGVVLKECLFWTWHV